PGLLARLAAHDPVRRPVGLAADLWAAVAQLGVLVVLEAAVGLPEPPGSSDCGRHDRWTRRAEPLHAAEHARDGAPGLRADGTSQGAVRADGHRQARAPQRVAAGRDRPRSVPPR